MWQDHPFSQRNNTSKIAVEVKVDSNGKEASKKILKGRVDAIRGLCNRVGGTLCQL